MNPEQQQIKIAEACGFYKEEPWLDGRPCWGHKDHPKHIGFEEIPDYLYDLNAMHEAIRILTDRQRAEFRKHLTKIWARDYNSRCGYFPSHDDSCNATAAQRAEAFLKTLKLWVE